MTSLRRYLKEFHDQYGLQAPEIYSLSMLIESFPVFLRMVIIMMVECDRTQGTREDFNRWFEALMTSGFPGSEEFKSTFLYGLLSGWKPELPMLTDDDILDAIEELYLKGENS